MTSKTTDNNNPNHQENSKKDKDDNILKPDPDSPIPDSSVSENFNNENNTCQITPEDELRQQLTQALKQAEEWQEKALRATAEMENSRRRLEKEKQDFAKYANSGLIKELLPALDNLARAIKILNEEKIDSNIINSMSQGVSMVEKDIRTVFEKYNVSSINPQAGEPFDPRYHEAMSEVKDYNLPPGNIVLTIEPGYMLFDRLLRPCRVVVNAKNLEQKQNRVDVKS